MTRRRITREELAGKVIDVHSHAGVSIKAYACREYPYAETVETLRCRQRASRVVDVNVVFPIGADLYFEPAELSAGRCVPAARPLSPAPFVAENEMLLAEIYEFGPQHAGHFLPFVAIDPGRDVQAQLDALRRLAKAYPIFGLKVNPVMVQTPVTELLTTGRELIELAGEKDWPILLHTTQHRQEQYSRADLAFEVIEKYPDLRFCLAHCIGFHREHVRRADELPNVWVDTAALTIQVQLAREENEIVASPDERIDADYSDHTKVMQAMMEQFPDTTCWGSDTPFYTFCSRRKQAEGVWREFALEASYEDELAALTALPHPLQAQAASVNPLSFLFGERKRG